MKTITLAALAAVLTLAACASPDSVTPKPAPAEQSQNGGEGTRFTCENGLSVQVRSLSNSQIELRLDDKQAVLNSAVAASGERYTAKDGSTQYFGSAQAGPDGSVGLYLSATSTPLPDGLKSSLLAAVLNEAAAVFQPEAKEAAE